MRVDDFDAATLALARALTTAGVQYVVLEDDDAEMLTIVPGPSQRNLDRLERLLKSRSARRAAVRLDVRTVDVADGRWAAYFHEARRVEVVAGLHLDVVPDSPTLRIRRADARAAMPELALTQRERDRLRRKRGAALRRARGRPSRSRRTSADRA